MVPASENELDVEIDTSASRNFPRPPAFRVPSVADDPATVFLGLVNPGAMPFGLQVPRAGEDDPPPPPRLDLEDTEMTPQVDIQRVHQRDAAWTHDHGDLEEDVSAIPAKQPEQLHPAAPAAEPS
eukprot:TRINITY_DN8438_c0_g1_i6.p2 TRINITY_DN8438_c0_g1~~TRINITY_DN8438_c0_g1_i6.p2  ORF type:complete len:125 (-),score=23.37 TRINITY_DN8438_c0_g1_i6:17-391(-)